MQNLHICVRCISVDRDRDNFCEKLVEEPESGHLLSSKLDVRLFLRKKVLSCIVFMTGPW